MAIRFPCPGCQQPLEVDDAWGGESVACPYCRRVVTAPRTSQWPGASVPMASPVRPAFDAPPPPAGYAPEAPPRPSSARRALALAVSGAALSALSAVFWAAMVFQQVLQKLGPDATPEQHNRAIQELLLSGQVPRNPLITLMAFLGAIASLMGLITAVRSLLGQESRRGTAIAACLIGAVFLFCQVLFMLNLSMARGMPR